MLSVINTAVYPTRLWRKLGPFRFRSTELIQPHETHWIEQLDLESYIYSVSPAGGPVALAIDPSALVQLTGKVTKQSMAAAKRSVAIYTQAGELITQFPFREEDEPSLATMEWVTDGKLALLLQNGRIRVFEPLEAASGPWEEISLSPVKETVITHTATAHFGACDIAARTSTGDYYLWRLPAALPLTRGSALTSIYPAEAVPEDICSITLTHEGGMAPSILAASTRGQVYSIKPSMGLDETGTIIEDVRAEFKDPLPHCGGGVMVSGSRDGSLVAVWWPHGSPPVEPEDEDEEPPAPAPPPNGAVGYLRLYDSSFSGIILSFTLDRGTEMSTAGDYDLPLAGTVRLAWVGRFAALLFRQRRLGSASPALPILCNSLMCLAPSRKGGVKTLVQKIDRGKYPLLRVEPDGLRLVSQKGCELVSPVDPTIVQLFDIRRAGSELGHMFEAFKSFQVRSHRADEIFRALKERIDDPAMERAGREMDYPTLCGLLLRAVEFEIDSFWAKMLLGASSYCQLFLEEDTPDHTLLRDRHVRLARFWRLVHSFRQNSITATVSQLMSIGEAAVIGQLLSLDKHALAVQSTRLINLQIAPCLEHWASRLLFLHPETADDVLANAIIDKYQRFTDGHSVLNFKRVGEVAVDSGRFGLAKLILEVEPSTKVKVGLYIKIEDYYNAILEALKVSDTNLACSVMAVAAESSEGTSQLIRLVSANEDALRLFLHLNRGSKPDLVYSVGQSCEPPNHKLMAQADVFRAFGATSAKKAAHSLTAAETTLGEQNLTKKEKKQASPSSLVFMVPRQRELLTRQRELSRETGVDLVGLTMRDTLVHLLLSGHQKFAEKLRDDLDVSEWTWTSACMRRMSLDRTAVSAMATFSRKLKRPDWLLMFEGARRVGSVSNAKMFALNLKDPLARLRCLLAIRQDRMVVEECQKLSIEMIQGLLPEFNGDDRAQRVLTRIVSEFQRQAEAAAQKAAKKEARAAKSDKDVSA